MSESVDNQLWQSLVDVGLDVKEARLYLAVLEAGRLPIADAAQQAFISRTNAYDVVRRLTQRGLLQLIEVPDSDVHRRRTVLEANDPHILLQENAVRMDRLRSMIPRLRAIQTKGTLPQVRYLEGAAGIRTALFESLEWASPIYGILSMADLMSVPGSDAMKEYIEGRRRRELELLVVRSSVKESTLDWPTSEDDFRVARLAPAPYIFTMTTLIGDHTVSTLSSRRENFAMVIESDEYAQQQRQLFEMLWQASTPTVERDPRPEVMDRAAGDYSSD